MCFVRRRRRRLPVPVNRFSTIRTNGKPGNGQVWLLAFYSAQLAVFFRELFIRSERGCRQTLFIVEVSSIGIVGPGITHIFRLWHSVARYNNSVAFNACIGPNEFFVGVGNGKLAERLSII